MSTEERELTRKFWDDPENLKRFRKIESQIMRDVDARLASGNTLLKRGLVTTLDDSIERCVDVGWPVYELSVNN